MLEKLIRELGKDLAMEDLISSTEDRHYFISFDAETEIEAVELGNSYLLKSMIGNCPQKNADAFLMRTMEANLFGIGTRGAVIGLHTEGKMLTLSLELDYNCSFKDFKEKLEDFISVMEFWRNAALKHE